MRKINVRKKKRRYCITKNSRATHQLNVRKVQETRVRTIRDDHSPCTPQGVSVRGVGNGGRRHGDSHAVQPGLRVRPRLGAGSSVHCWPRHRTISYPINPGSKCFERRGRHYLHISLPTSP